MRVVSAKLEFERGQHGDHGLYLQQWIRENKLHLTLLDHCVRKIRRLDDVEDFIRVRVDT
jgi:hypothetical protein